MTKDFYYNVNGAEFHDTVAFGQAWKEAKALAREEHCGIERTVICGENIRYEFYAKGGIFVSDEFRTDWDMEIL